MYRDTSLEFLKILDLTTPIYAQMELTQECPDRCIMCYNVWHGGYELGPKLTETQHVEIVDALNPHIFSMVFSGGEPTTVPWLSRLIERCRSANVDCTLITNGKLIDKGLALSLHSAGLQGAQISLHHYEDGISDWITGTGNSVRRTLTGAKNLLSHIGDESIGICMVVNKVTVNDVYQMGVFIHRHGFRNLVIGVLSYSGRAAVNNLRIDSHDLQRIHVQLEELHNDLDLGVGFTGGMPFCIMPKGWQSSPVQMHNTCDAAIHQLVVGPDGECRPCVEYPFSGGNILTERLEDIWSSKPFEKIRSFRNIPPLCVNCDVVSECHGGCRAAALAFTGDLCGLDPFLVQR